jgi:crotonobetainyl-CoA:carnitine CoA-transferase CaiB-like acyl-CoA transferase
MGCTGPHTTDLSYGPNVINNTGATYLWNYAEADTPTAEARTQHSDFMGGVAGAFGVVAALLQRTVTGRGDMIDNSQLEIDASLLGAKYMEYSLNKRDPKPQGSRSVIAAPYGS